MTYIISLLNFLPEKDYPKNHKNMGKHIRKRRIDLGLMQKDVAKIIAVSECSIWNWTHRWKPGKRYLPKIEEI